MLPAKLLKWDGLRCYAVESSRLPGHVVGLVDWMAKFRFHWYLTGGQAPPPYLQPRPPSLSLPLLLLSFFIIWDNDALGTVSYLQTLNAA